MPPIAPGSKDSLWSAYGLAGDSAGQPLASALLPYPQSSHHRVKDLRSIAGPSEYYADTAARTARAVLDGSAAQTVLICGDRKRSSHFRQQNSRDTHGLGP